MTNLQALKDVDEIDHLTLEKTEDCACNHIDHFTVKRIAPQKFSADKAANLLRHVEMWYPETKEIVNITDFNDTESLYKSLRTVREIILKLQEV